ncbi:MAG: hypothetical protein DBX59_04765 [Bacillota bacterium]|nr:MAG: hypothetical protein DBX59_04765 [Bacillota bacterium]
MVEFFSVPSIKDFAEPVNKDYKVFINGRECPVYDARSSAVPYNGYNDVGAAFQRPKNQSETAAFLRVTADEELRFSVEFAAAPADCPASVLTGAKKSLRTPAVVRPLEKNVSVKETGNRAEFTVTEAGTYIFEPYGRHCALHVFVDAPRVYDKEGATMYFGAGLHFTGVINVKSGDRIFLDNGALVYGSILAHDATDVKIYGNGVLDDSYEVRITPHCYEDYTKGNIRLYNCKNVSVEGIILRDSANWCFSMYECEDIFIDNVKIVGQWRYNTDGIDLMNCRRVNIENCFVRSFDDSICMKATEGFKGDVTDISVKNCTLWCDWGRTLEIGLETACDEYARISFENCYLVHNSAAALDVQGGNYARLHDISFKDMAVEFEYGALPEQMQTSSAEYDAKGGVMRPALIAVGNPAMIDMDMYKYLFTEEQLADPRRGTVENARFENIRVYLDEGVNMPASYVRSFYEGFEFKDIVIENVTVNGKRITAEKDLNLTIERVKNFSLK